MPLNIDFSKLIRLRESIGASIAPIEKIRNVKITENPFEIEILQHGEVTLSKEELDQQLREVGGLCAIGNTQVTLHIAEPYEDEESLSKIPAQKPKYHISECKTLDQMRNKGRFDRYVTSAKEDGYFTVMPWDHNTGKRTKEMRAKLLPCRNCLEKINYKGYASSNKNKRNQIVSGLDLSVFFAEFKTIFRSLPRYSEHTYPAGGYSEDWSEITNTKREQNGWKCSCCGVCLSDNRQYLHTHHKNGIRGDNADSNLEVLCIVCHSNRPNHSHMKVTMEETIKIKNFRLGQNLMRNCAKCG